MKSVLVALATATAVSAHGWVDNITISGQFYQVPLHFLDHEDLVLTAISAKALPALSRPIHGRVGTQAH